MSVYFFFFSFPFFSVSVSDILVSLPFPFIVAMHATTVSLFLFYSIYSILSLSLFLSHFVVFCVTCLPISLSTRAMFTRWDDKLTFTRHTKRQTQTETQGNKVVQTRPTPHSGREKQTNTHIDRLMYDHSHREMRLLSMATCAFLLSSLAL